MAASLNTYTCLVNGKEIMVHPGLPDGWVIFAWICMVGLLIHALVSRGTPSVPGKTFFLERLPLLGPFITVLMRSPWPLVGMKILFVTIFLLVIAAGLTGVPFADRNLATTLTWTVWWTLVVISVFFLGSVWCSVCPWNTLADWLVKRRLVKRPPEEAGLGLKLPQTWRTVWPALFLFVGLTWLELGVGITMDPHLTAVLALIMVVLATVSLALFERKAFCRYGCPIGRTLGFYSQLAPVALRPLEGDRCQRCDTLACYHGSEHVEPCPTYLTMGRFSQNTYCLSCGACVLSCPHGNVSWQWRPMAMEARQDARPHWDEAWFMVALVCLTSFHGITMLPQWEESLFWLTRYSKEWGGLLSAFTLGMVVMLALTYALYGGAVALSQRWAATETGFRRWFSLLSFATLPVAFAYHMAHNLNHFVRESRGLSEVWLNPFGKGTLPMASQELIMRMHDPLISMGLLHAIQTLIMIWGVAMGLMILKNRLKSALRGDSHGTYVKALLPVAVFLVMVTGLNLWLLNQDMMMRF